LARIFDIAIDLLLSSRRLTASSGRVMSVSVGAEQQFGEVFVTRIQISLESLRQCRSRPSNCV